jgi:hypothetical protein
MWILVVVLGFITMQRELDGRIAMVNVPKFKAHELDTNNIVSGYYYCENGYWLVHGRPDLDKPVKRHKIVDEDGIHRDIDETSLEPA